jgi:hypothetical protein
MVSSLSDCDNVSVKYVLYFKKWVLGYGTEGKYVMLRSGARTTHGMLNMTVAMSRFFNKIVEI